jgi:hypothetical protein
MERWRQNLSNRNPKNRYMKKSALLLFGFYFISFLSCFSTYSQANYSKITTPLETNFLNRPVFFYNKLVSTPDLKVNLNFKPFNANVLSIYNRNTKLNDVYSYSKESYYYEKSVPLCSNFYDQKDSFNPNGANNFGVGVLIGSLNALLSVISK